MVHDPEQDAARYLADDLSPGQRDGFSRHLLTCSQCRREVELARRGRAALEAQRTVVSVELRDRMRALVESEPAAAPLGLAARTPTRRGRALLAVAASFAGVLAVAVAVAVADGAVGRTPEPAALREAVQDYDAARLPGAGLPEQPAPNLSALRLQSVGAGGGTYAGLAVDGYAYRDPAGRRLVLYLSDQPFPEAPDARQLAGADGPWIADRGDVVVLCARLPHNLLLVGQDRALVRSTALALGVL